MCSSEHSEHQTLQKLIAGLYAQSKAGKISEYQECLEKIAALKIYPNNNQLLYCCLLSGITVICTDVADTESLSDVKKQEILRECVREAELIISYCRHIYALLDSLQLQIQYLGNAYMKANDCLSAKKTYEILVNVFMAVSDNEGYMPPFHIGQPVFTKLAVISMQNGDTNGALLWLEYMYDYTCAQAVEYNQTLHAKSPLICKHTMEFNYPDYEPRELIESELSQKCFDSIREMHRFRDFAAKVRLL